MVTALNMYDLLCDIGNHNIIENSRISALYGRYTNVDIKKISRLMRQETYIDAKYGFVTEIIK